MEQRVESKKTKRGGTVAQSENGHALPFLPMTKQFNTRCCVRCDGLLVKEWCYDLDNTGEHNAKVLRCVQCGHRVDPVILRNRIQPPVTNDQVRRVRYRHAVRIERTREAA